jgi:hypothetical protein
MIKIQALDQGGVPRPLKVQRPTELARQGRRLRAQRLLYQLHVIALLQRVGPPSNNVHRYGHLTEQLTPIWPPDRTTYTDVAT